MTPEQIAELEALVAKATPGPWEVYEQTIAASTPERRADNAKAEMLLQVQMTTEMVDHIYLLSAGDKCPATTGCGPTSATNADLIVTLVNNLPAILAALKAQQPDEAMVARALAPHMEGGREFDQMPPDRMALRKWSREGMCDTNDATQDDALEAASAVAPLFMEYGARLMQEAAIADFMTWYPGASIEKPEYAAAKALRASLEAIDPATIVKDASNG